jgi:hypothetical protein
MHPPLVLLASVREDDQKRHHRGHRAQSALVEGEIESGSSALRPANRQGRRGQPSDGSGSSQETRKVGRRGKTHTRSDSKGRNQPALKPSAVKKAPAPVLVTEIENTVLVSAALPANTEPPGEGLG